MKIGVAAVLLFLACAALFLAASDATAAEPPKLSGHAKVHKCIAAFYSARGTCLKEIRASYWNHKLNIGADCCKAIKEADDDCTETIFEHFRNPPFVLLLKEHCSKKA